MIKGAVCGVRVEEINVPASLNDRTVALTGDIGENFIKILNT